MKELHTEIEILAPPEKVWEVLADFPRYEEWNPFIRKVSGAFHEGGYLTVHSVQGGEKTVYQPGIVRYNEGWEFSWLNTRGMPGILDIEHIQRVEELDGNRTLFINRQELRGFLVPFMWNRLENELGEALLQMNEALKNRVESMMTTA